MKPKPFVLVHGAGCGGWTWDHVTPRLRDAGHEVCTPDLELHDPQSTVDDHATQVIESIGDLRDVVLVGHSYGGMPVAVVTDRIPDRIARTVYLDAFAPSDGENAFAERPDLERSLTPNVQDGLLPPIRPEFIGADPEHYDELRERLTTTPWRCFIDPVRLSGRSGDVPRTYVWCTTSGYGPVAERVRDDPRWDYRELDTKHMCMYSAPEAVVELLLDCAA